MPKSTKKAYNTAKKSVNNVLTIGSMFINSIKPLDKEATISENQKKVLVNSFKNNDQINSEIKKNE